MCQDFFVKLPYQLSPELIMDLLIQKVGQQMMQPELELGHFYTFLTMVKTI